MASFLLCDDAEFIRKTLAKILEKEGHEVIGEAGNGVMAVSQYALLKPDIVLTDIVMPEMDGISATKKIMEINPNAKVIVVSSMGTMDKVVDAITAGAKDFIVKPFDPQKIIECVSKYI